MLVLSLQISLLICQAAKTPVSLTLPHFPPNFGDHTNIDGGLIEQVGRQHALAALHSSQEAREAQGQRRESGLWVDPGSGVHFGEQFLGVRAVRYVIFRPFSNFDSVSILSISASDPQFAVSCADEGNYTLSQGDSATYKVMFVPHKLGQITAFIRVETNKGQGLYDLTAMVRLGRVRMVVRNEILWGENDGGSELQVTGLAEIRGVDVRALVEFPVILEAGKTEQLARVPEINNKDDYLVVLTNLTDFYVALRPRYIELFPSILSFGIVNSADIRHSLPVLISNRSPDPVRITRIISDSQRVTVATYQSLIPAFSTNATVVTVRFCPRLEGLFQGKIAIYTNTSAIPVFLSYSGVALFDFLRYNISDLTFDPTDTNPRPVAMTTNFTRKVKLLRVHTLLAGVTVSEFLPERSVSTTRSRVMMVVTRTNRDNMSRVETVAIETEAGVVAIPVVVELNSVRCLFLSTFDTCESSNPIPVRRFESESSYRVGLRLTNTGNLQRTVSVQCVGNRYSFSVTAVSDAGEKVELMAAFGETSCIALRSLPLLPHTKYSLEITLYITQGPPSASLQLESGSASFLFLFHWSEEGYVEVTPETLVLEDTHFGRVQRFSVVVKHTHRWPLAVLGWKTNVDSLEFEPAVKAIPPQQSTVIGELVFPRKKGFGSPHPFDFSREVDLSELKAWEVAKRNSVPRRLVGRLSIHTNATHPLHISFDAGAKSPRFSSPVLDFGISTPWHRAQRYLLVSNPLDFELFLQPLLLANWATLQMHNVGEVLKRNTRAGDSGFLIAQEAQRVFIVPSRKTSKIGPISFRPSSFGASNSTLLLRNNMTLFEVVELRGDLVASALSVESVALAEPVRQPVSRSFAIVNTGGASVFITGVRLENSGGCWAPGIRLLSCDLHAILEPEEYANIHFEVGALDAEVGIKVTTIDGELTFFERVEGSESSECTQSAGPILAVLEAVGCGVLLTLIRAISKKLPARTVLHRLFQVEEPAARIAFPTHIKKKAKRPKRPKPKPQEPLVSEISSAAVSDPLYECRFVDSSSDEDYLDEYKQSGLFSGFFLPRD